MRIFALIELGVAIPNGLYHDVSVSKNQVADWITFIMALDGEERETETGTLENRLVAYIKRRKKEGASLWIMRKELSQMAAELKDAKQKKLFYGIVKDAFVKNFPAYRKTFFKLLFGTGQ